MALQTKVKIAGINNLTDARYCAGMGVEWLGFCIDEDQTDFIGYQKIENIIEWISGVQMVGEIYSNQQTLPEQVLDFGFDALEINELQFHYLQNALQANHKLATLPLFLHWAVRPDTNFEELATIWRKKYTAVNHFILNLPLSTAILAPEQANFRQAFTQLCKEFPVLLGANFGIKADNILELLAIFQPKGIVLAGGNEIRAGLKDMDELATILEKLEIED